MTEIQYRHQKTSVSLINYSFVWVTYEGRKLLIGQTKELVEQLIISKAKQLDCIENFLDFLVKINSSC
jgi:REP element-mobilizing transposase RayT